MKKVTRKKRIVRGKKVEQEVNMEVKQELVKDVEVKEEVLTVNFRLDQPNIGEPVVNPQGSALHAAKVINNGKLFPFFIPYDSGENPGDGATIPITINGYKWIVKKGEQLMIPEELCTILKKRLESEGKLASHPQNINNNPRLREFFNI